MAATEATKGIFTKISAIDADWDAGETIPIHSIEFIPGASDDELVVFEQSVAGGVECCRLKSTDGEPRIKYFDGNDVWPVIDFYPSIVIESFWPIGSFTFTNSQFIFAPFPIKSCYCDRTVFHFKMHHPRKGAW